MQEKNHSLAKRLLSVVLSLLLLIGLVPIEFLPVEAIATEEGRFVLVVETEDGLVVAPEYVSYTDNQIVREALMNSSHTFNGIEDDWISRIDGVVGNYSRIDEDGSYDLNKPATDVEYVRFCEGEDIQLTEGLKQLMTAMAEYNTKEKDVQTAAKDAYDTAYEQFVGIDSDSASVLAKALEDAMKAYEDSQTGTQFQVTFMDGANVYKDAIIEVTNTYGKVWTDDGDGVMSLPAGEDYAFCINKGDLWVEGSFSVATDMTVTTSLPQETWLQLDEFRLSGSYEAQKAEDGTFADDEYTLDDWSGRKLQVAIPDAFTGNIYTHATYNADLFAEEEIPTLTAIHKDAKTGEEVKKNLSFGSLVDSVENVLVRGSNGNTVVYRISNQAQDGYTYSQDYAVDFVRVPTLAGIEVKDQNNVGQAATDPFDSDVFEYTYKVIDSVESVNVTATPLDQSYSVLINGEDATKGVNVALETEKTYIKVQVKAGDYSSEYTLTIWKGASKSLTIKTARADVTIEVTNKNGQVMPCEKIREGSNNNRYLYSLVPGETYNYVATAGEYYHVTDSFTLEDYADSTITVDVEEEDWLSELDFGYKGTSASNKGNLPLNKEFDSLEHRYQVEFIDSEHLAYVWATSVDDVTITAIYEQKHNSGSYHGKETALTITSGNEAGLKLNRFLMDENPIENTVIIRLTRENNGVTYYQDYVVDFKRQLTLENLTAECDNVTVSIVQEKKEGETEGTVGFARTVKEYNVTVSMEADALELYPVLNSGYKCYGESQLGYRIEANGEDITEAGKAIVELDGTLETQNVVITVSNDKAPNGTAEYLIHILKSPPVETTFKLNPKNAVVAIYETMSGERIWPDDNGIYKLCEGYKYEYTLTSFEYIAKAGVLEVTRDEQKALIVKDGDEVYTVEEGEAGGGSLEIEWSLEKAEVNENIQKDIPSCWPNFRGNENNNAVTDTKVPTAADEGTLYWANKIGEGYGTDAVGSPILVDGDLVTYSGRTIYRLDTVTGEIKATGTMCGKSAHATTPPSYSDGMIFIALANGTVQAFNADTLESLWIYRDPLGGQPVCPLTISDGYLYTGFWNSEIEDANFVSLSITDEDPQKTDEVKKASWRHATKGGYYWAGAYATSDFVIVGTDDGEDFGKSQTAKLLIFDAMTGKLLDSWENLNGDIRSTVVYDEENDAYCFTSKGGSFYSVQVVKTEDGWKFANGWSVKLENGVGGTPMSTSSPTVYNGRAYVGVSGAGQFSAYFGHNITVIDLDRQAIAYKAYTQGYPQTSGLLTTAYEETSGYVYVYFMDNMTPGKLRVLRDKKGQKSADYITTEETADTVYNIFSPTGNQAQYAICSPIVDEYGTLYFKNDSAHMMAYGSNIKKIEVTKNPDKMVYKHGEAFDPTGMVVTATYENNKTRDITEYVTFNLKNVTTSKNKLTISFPYVMYHNVEDGTSMTSGVSTTTPVTTLQLEVDDSGYVVDENLGDINENGAIDTIDASMIISYCNKKLDLNDGQLALADVNMDGYVDTEDAELIISYYYEEIDSF